MMRKLCFGVSLTVLMFFLNSQGAAALSESEIEDQVTAADVLPFAENILCGGVASPSDERFLSYYQREKEPLSCKLIRSCSDFDIATGTCKGKSCRIVRRKGLPDASYAEKDCVAGVCTEIKPHTGCSESAADRYREYKCDGVEKAECYYSKSSQLNCVVQYGDSPVAPADPAGAASLGVLPQLPFAPREGTSPWTVAPGSNASVHGEKTPQPFDASMEALTLDEAIFLSDARRRNEDQAL